MNDKIEDASKVLANRFRDSNIEIRGWISRQDILHYDGESIIVESDQSNKERLIEMGSRVGDDRSIQLKKDICISTVDVRSYS